MAALSDLPLARVVDLRQLRSDDLAPLLAEEVDTWRSRLDWDFRPSVSLVERFVEMQALTGYALVFANRIVGYIYYVCEERKGLIGDLYVMEQYRSIENENLLLAPALKAMIEAPWLKRVESQLMMLSSSFDRQLPFANRLRVYPRSFMETDSLAKIELATLLTPGIVYESWQDRHQEEASRVIAAAYRGHVDSDINDQYRSSGGARRFLLNIVQYPGCGVFYQPGSFLAVDSRTGKACGMCLTSLVSESVGHITQVCVTPDVRGTGVGYELMRRSLAALSEHGCEKVSLTVTSSNAKAISLYEKLGFEERRRFGAYVWEGF